MTDYFAAVTRQIKAVQRRRRVQVCLFKDENKAIHATVEFAKTPNFVGQLLR